MNLRELQSTIREKMENQRICKKCFMNGKACSYQKEIENYLAASRDQTGGKINKSFVMMPFRNVMDEIYRTQLEPHFSYSCNEVKRADDINMTGFVICEKICRQIQESSLVVSELTYDSANVFYELGLAYALNKNIAIFIQDKFKNSRSKILTKLNIPEQLCNFYEPFSELRTSETRIWNVSNENRQNAASNASDSIEPAIVILLGDPSTIEEEIEIESANRADSSGKYNEYYTNKVFSGAIHKAISVVEKENRCEDQTDRITIYVDSETYTGGIRRSRPGKSIEKEESNTDPIKKFSVNEIESYIRKSRCVIICASIREPVTYFWMGFAHGLEKDVIPITLEQEGTCSLPFDVRALWHISVSKSKLKDLQMQMESIYRIILSKGKDTFHRREFWDPVINSGSVLLFIGSVEYIEANKRHVVGEWDYRTVSEIISFLNSTKETLETVIQTPVFQLSQFFGDKRYDELKSKEIERMKEMLFGKKRNAIIVGSADVNDMTDFALSHYAGIDYFNPAIRSIGGFTGFVGFKHKGDYKTYETQSVYFKWLEKEQGMQNERGFYFVSNAEEICLNPKNKYSSTIEPDSKSKYSIMYSHFAKFFIDTQCIIIIQGISGPATLGLAQLLTGAKFKQFTAFYENEENEDTIALLNEIALDHEDEYLKEFFSCNSNSLPKIEEYSESMVRKINSAFDASGNTKSVEAIVKIYIANPSDNAATHDQRKILWWSFAQPPKAIVKPEIRLRKQPG